MEVQANLTIGLGDGCAGVYFRAENRESGPVQSGRNKEISMRLMMSAAAAALALGTFASAAPATAQAQAQPERKINISKAATKAVTDLQNAVTANDAANLPAKFAAAKAAATTDDDRFYIGSQALRGGIAAKDNALIADGLEMMIASNKATPQELPALYLNLGKAYNNLKQPAKAGPWLEKAVQANAGAVDALVILAEMRAGEGKPTEAVGFIRRAIAAETAAGKKANESWYKRALTLAYNAKQPVAIDISRDWVKAYPTSANWKDSLRIYRNLSKPPEPVLFDLLRLARTTNALDGDIDYNAYVFIADNLRNAGEGQRLLDEAGAAGKINLSTPKYQEMVKALKLRPKPGADILAKSAETQLAGNDGAALAVTANRFYGIGNYARAVELFKAALTKPGIDKDQVTLQLGIAQLAAGDKAGAKASFEAVGGTRTEVAKYWLTYLSTQA